MKVVGRKRLTRALVKKLLLIDPVGYHVNYPFGAIFLQIPMISEVILVAVKYLYLGIVSKLPAWMIPSSVEAYVFCPFSSLLAHFFSSLD